jgi:hypothetical protein
MVGMNVYGDERDEKKRRCQGGNHEKCGRFKGAKHHTRARATIDFLAGNYLDSLLTLGAPRGRLLRAASRNRN